MIFPQNRVSMIVFFKCFEFQAYRCLNKKMISFLSTQQILGMLRELSIYCLSLEAHSFFIIQYFYTGVSALESLGFLVNDDIVGSEFRPMVTKCQPIKEKAPDLKQNTPK